MPFLQTLGYDIFNPLEVIPEFRSAFGSKNDARVDYAIVFNQEPTILIEVITPATEHINFVMQHRQPWDV